MSALGQIDGPPSVEPTPVPRFSVRFAKGSAELTLAAPLLFAGGRLTRLRAGVERAARVTDFARGWRALARRRSTLLELELELEPSWLGLGDVSLVSSGAQGLLVERRRPWGHVALALRPVIDVRPGAAPELLLVPTDARAVHVGPRPPLAELVELGGERSDGSRLQPRFDARRGALVLGDALLVALTEALVGHGVRVPERGLSVERAAVRAGKLVLTAGLVGTDDDASLRELGRRLGPLLSLAAAGEAIPEATLSALPPRLRAALGGAPVEGDPVVRLTEAAARGEGRDELARLARAVDEHEPSPGVATDALLFALAHAADGRVARELALRAFARSPSRPDVIASTLELAASSADLCVAAEVLAAAAQASGQERDPFVDVALARLDEQRGDHEAALARWQRAAAHRGAPGEALEGLARQEVRRGLLEEARVAVDRAAQAYRELGRSRAAIRAELSAARIVLAGREPRQALERLGELPGRYPARALDELSIERTTLAARAHRAAGDEARAALVESELCRHVEELGPAAPDEAVQALFDAAQAAALAGTGARADAMLATLGRVRPERDLRAAIREAERAALVSRVEAASPGDRAALARSLADSLTGRGLTEEAAELLHRAGELDRDLALLRAAIDTAERAGHAAQARGLIDRTLAIVGEGPARAALEARRQKLG